MEGKATNEWILFKLWDISKLLENGYIKKLSLPLQSAEHDENTTTLFFFLVGWFKEKKWNKTFKVNRIWTVLKLQSSSQNFYIHWNYISSFVIYSFRIQVYKNTSNDVSLSYYVCMSLLNVKTAAVLAHFGALCNHIGWYGHNAIFQ